MKNIFKNLIYSVLFFLAVFFILPHMAFADIVSPIRAKTFGELLMGIMNYFKTIAGGIAVLFFIIGGVMYMIAGGNKEMMEKAKKTLIFAMVGLAIVLAAPLFLQDILLILQGGGGSSTSRLMVIVLNVLMLLLSIIGALGIMGLLNAAVILLVSTGDQKTLSAGKKAFAHSAIGIALAAGSLILVRTISQMILGG